MSITANLRAPLFAGAGAIAFGVVCLCFFFAIGGGSRGAWTALAAVFGASVALGINLVFDLQGSTDVTTITAEYTVDRAVPQIRQWIYARSLGDRYATEVLANDLTLKSDPQALENDLNKSTTDLRLFSLAAYLEIRQRDWQMEQQRYTTSNGIITTESGKSDATNPKDCTKISQDQISQMLKKSGNIFAQARAVQSVPYVCLPPQSAIRIDQTSITLSNPFGMIKFLVKEPFIELSTAHPTSHTMDVPTLQNGKPRFETRAIGIHVTRKSSWLTAQHRDFGKYEEWSKGVVDGARAWFETKATDESGPPWFGGDGEGDEAMFWTGSGGGQGQISIRGSRIYHGSPQ